VEESDLPVMPTSSFQQQLQHHPFVAACPDFECSGALRAPLHVAIAAIPCSCRFLLLLLRLPMLLLPLLLLLLRLVLLFRVAFSKALTDLSKKLQYW